MSNLSGFLEYPISVRNIPEYWKAKAAFSRHTGQNSVWTMIAVESGRFAFKIGDVSGEAAGGDIMLCPPNMEFAREIITPLSFFYVLFTPQEAETDDEARMIHLLHDLFGYKFTTPEQDRLYNNFRHMLAVYGKSDKNSKKWTTHFFCDIWSMFCMEAETLVQYGNVVHDPLMKEARDLIDRQAFLDFQMKDIAIKIRLHPVQFTRRFQKVFGVSPTRYLFSLRMEKAKSLLIQTDYTLDHVAQLCGYDNGYYFSRMFTQFTKMNPSTFRRIHALPSP